MFKKIVTEVNGQLLSYGINVSQTGDRDTTKTGAIFRMDTRAGSPYFSVKRQAIGGSTEFSDMQISQAGDIGLGGWASDTNSFPGNVSILSRATTVPGLIVRETAAQTADIVDWQDSTGANLGLINSTGAISFTGSQTTDITTSAGRALVIDSGTTGGISIGTSANAKTVTVGSTNGASVTNIQSGTNNILFKSATLTLATFNNTGTITWNMTNYASCGTALRTNAAGLMTCVSDERLKDIEGDYTAGLPEIMNIHPKNYTWKAGTDLYDGGVVISGFTVQDVMAAGIPNAGHLNGNGYYNFDETPVLAAAVNAIKEEAVLIGDISQTNTDNTLLNIIQSESAHDPVSIIMNKISTGTKFLTDFVAARGTAVRGYFDEVFAKKVHTEQICVKKSDGNEVCVNGDQLDALLNNVNITSPTTLAPIPVTTPPASTPPPQGGEGEVSSPPTVGGVPDSIGGGGFSDQTPPTLTEGQVGAPTSSPDVTSGQGVGADSVPAQ